MIPINIILIILVIHWMADYVLQSTSWINNMSKNGIDLFLHSLSYSVIWMFGATLLFSFPCNESILGVCIDIKKLGAFIGITFILHSVVDYITSKFINKSTSHNKTNTLNINTAILIGFDHTLHYIQLMLTYLLLS